jgi:hypothetical protein
MGSIPVEATKLIFKDLMAVNHPFFCVLRSTLQLVEYFYRTSSMGKGGLVNVPRSLYYTRYSVISKIKFLG